MGHVGGLLSGYEFVSEDGAPRVALPDDWYNLAAGPYGGGETHGSAGVNRVFTYGRIASDDDYHIDFFNQLILSEKGVSPSYKEIADSWAAHQVSDWGGGNRAMAIINDYGIPPFTGLYEYGNIWHWCTESYIENETLGMVFPGIPQSAYKLAERFTKTVGDFDSSTWGVFYAVLYAEAYFETEAAVALEKAALSLPNGSWPLQIYNECKALHDKYPGNWREAIVEIEKRRREIFGCDNIMCSPDVNNAFAILAILYGENDFETTVKIASLAGYDGDCTAASVGGVMGIIGGSEAIPQKIWDVVYKSGDGVYINDKTFVPHIGKDYPDEQTWDSIVSLYTSNCEKQIKAAGGKIKNGQYYIPFQAMPVPDCVVLKNSDFERGIPEGFTGEWNVESGNAHTGDYYGIIRHADGEAVASISIDKGAYYRVSAYVRTGALSEGTLFVKQGVAAKSIGFRDVTAGWVLRSIIFRAEETSAEVGFLMNGGSGSWVGFDDITVTKVEDPGGITHIDITQNREGGAEFKTKWDGTEKNVAVKYRRSDIGNAKYFVFVNNELYLSVLFPSTGKNESVVYIPIKARNGTVNIQLTPVDEKMEITSIDVMGLCPDSI